MNHSLGLKGAVICTVACLLSGFSSGQIARAGGEKVELLGFSSDGEYAAVLKSFQRYEAWDKVDGVDCSFSLNVVLRLPDGAVMGIFREENPKIQAPPGKTGNGARSAAGLAQYAPEYVFAAPRERFAEIAKTFHIFVLPRRPGRQGRGNPGRLGHLAEGRVVRREISHAVACHAARSACPGRSAVVARRILTDCNENAAWHSQLSAGLE